MNVLILNGPNLNRLGTREPHIYGETTYDDLVDYCRSTAAEVGLEVDVRQTNHEGDMVEWLHEAAEKHRPVILNGAAWTHYSIALRDACAQLTAPLVEVHISNIHAREEFRRHSLTAPVADGVITGLGITGYGLALRWLAERVKAAD